MTKLEDIINEECAVRGSKICASDRLEMRLTQLLLFEKANRKYERQRGSKGFIYLIKDSDGYYKIGRATNLQVRLRKYYSENAKAVDLIDHAYVDDYIQKEIDLQKKFEDKHYRGEWFSLEKKDEAIITGIFKDWEKSAC